MFRIVGTLFITVFLVTLTTTPIDAAFSMTLSDLTNQDVLSNEQEISVNASMSGLPSESYFRIALQKSSGDSYFGYMKNNAGDWVKIQAAQDCKNYFKISDLTTSVLSFNTKIGDDNVINNGSYTLKLRRYTASCSSYSDSNAVVIQINLPTPTPSPPPDPTPSERAATPTPNPTQTPTAAPTKSPSPRPTPTKTPTATPQQTPTASPEELSTESNPLVLGIEKTPKPEFETKSNYFPKMAIIFVAVGILLIGVSAYLAWQKTKI